MLYATNIYPKGKSLNIFCPTINLPMQDAKLIESTPFRDMRGDFSVLWDTSNFFDAEIHFSPKSSAVSYNKKSGTLRGMHYQHPPHGQNKLVSCTNGKILDVMADLRINSPTYLHWSSIELSEADGRSIFIPSGYAHGFLTLTDHATVAYLIDGEYRPEAAGTIRWNDPELGICWPILNPIISERDMLAPDFSV